MSMDMSRIQQGMDVLSGDGDKVGEVQSVGPNYVLVQKGFLFHKDMYVPASAISNAGNERLYLNVNKSDINNMDWSEPPAETATATTGGAYTESTTGTLTEDTTAGSTAADTGFAEPRSTTTQTSDEGTTRIPRHEEELVAERQQREAGRVRIDKDVEEEEQTLDVPRSHEEVHVSSRTVDRPATDTDQAFRDESVEVPVSEEEVRVRKEPRVAEELDVSKEAREDTEQVSDTVRKERFNVENTGDVREEHGYDQGS